MQLDFESLYVFGGALLDQCALVCLYIEGIENPEKKYKRPFFELVKEYEKKQVRINISN